MVLVLCASACLETSTVECPNGVICAAGYECINDGCALPDQIDACDGVPEGDPCTFLGGNGVCTDGVCVGDDCGNGVVDPGETCDDENTQSGDGCRADCLKAEVCGDGALDLGEGCDEGTANADTLDALCRTDCTLPHCGDGVVVSTAGEACEPGVALDVDCTRFGYYVADGLTCGSLCQFDTTGCAEKCGDDELNGDEICDGAPPPGVCMDYGFDAGPLGCTACAPGFDDCHFIDWKPFLGEPAGVVAIYGWPDDVYAISTSTIRRFDGHAWSTHATLPTAVYAGSRARLWGSGPDDLYAAGPNLIVRVTPSGVEPLFTDGGTFSVWGSAANDVWVVGHTDNQVRHYDGSTWSTQSASAPAAIKDVWASGPDNAIVVGDGFVSRWDGVAWTVTALPQRDLARVWGSGPSDVYAGGNSGVLVHFDGTSWRDVTTGCDIGISAIAGTGPDDVYVVGNGAILHFDGVAWALRGEPTSHQTLSVWPLSDRDVIASDDVGIYRYRGAAWAPLSFRSVGARLLAVATAGPTEMFAVGSSGTILRHDGRAWSLEPRITSARLSGAWASGPNDRFAVGYGGTILHDDGSGWTTMPSGTTSWLFTVWGSGPSDVYAGGATPAGLLHYDGSAWSPVTGVSPDPIQAVWGRASNDVYAVGGGKVYHYDGDNWTATTISTSNLFAITGNATQVFVSGAAGVFVNSAGSWYSYSEEPTTLVGLSASATALWGVTVSGEVYRDFGGDWFRQADATLIARGIVANGARASVVGDQGVVMSYADSEGFRREVPYTAATEPLYGPPYFDLWAADGMVFATSMYTYTHALARYDGAIWSAVRTPELDGIYAADRIWGAATDELFLLGHAAPWIHRFDGITFSPQTVPGVISNDGQGLTDLWGSASNDVYAVGEAGVIVHFDGNNWTSATAAAADLRAVWGSASDDVFAVGDGGTIVHYNGASWTAQSSGVTTNLNDVWGSGAGDVFAVGVGGVVLHHDGTGWSPLDSGTTAEIRRVGGTGPGDVFFTEAAGILHYDGAVFARVRPPSGDGHTAVWADGDSVYFAGANRGIDRLLRTAPW